MVKYAPYQLNFKQASGTSRGVLTQKLSYIIWVDHNENRYYGECGLLHGLSFDAVPNYEQVLQQACNEYNNKTYNYENYRAFPSIQFAFEMLQMQLNHNTPYLIYNNSFYQNQAPISINGLIWMGTKEFMHQQITEKLKTGFTTIKLKIGAINIQDELDLLKYIRSQFSASDITLRVDANGAFAPNEALEKLKQLSEFDIHSIEQPIRQHQPQEMAKLCAETPVPIALDEELIGVLSPTDKLELLQTIQPQYIILKPSFVGGIQGSNEWIEAANAIGADWWATSALESSIGLNAIAQFTAETKNPLPQGLGTGQLYTNNFESPLQVVQGTLQYNQQLEWKVNV